VGGVVDGHPRQEADCRPDIRGRWDYETPIEETLRALDDGIRRNEVRYIGTSSQWAYQFADALHTSERLGLERFVSMQNHYSLVYRE